MDYNQIETGTRLELDLYDENGEKIRPQFISQFETMLDENKLEVHSPLHEGKVYPIHKGTLMEVSFSKQAENYIFEARAVERLYKGKLAMLRIQPLEEIRKIQRRAFYRLVLMVDIKYRLIDSLKMNEEDRGEFNNSVTKDISGGGICLVMDESPIMGDFVECKLVLGKEVTFIGQVIRIITHSTGKYKKYEVGVQFKKIGNKDRENVISYIFETQRNLLKKGWSKI